ncbi:MAG: imidazole glycerol phosphate synthase subunit HisH [Desulfobacca sp.]|uniref:imidazole glycerol phosphate synthase subunit HisH n=1 Tax=Desulfobacca sp. TaxID=2067990 RepID=UPI00404A0A6A
MIAILDYQAGNLASVARSCQALTSGVVVTQDPAVVARAERIIFPGVGAAREAMSHLRRLGLDLALQEAWAAGKPILGICLGAQIILTHSAEGDTPCLGLLSGDVRRLDPRGGVSGERLKIPHMGWNQVRVVQEHPVLAGIPAGAEFYFVHSFYPHPATPELVLGVTEYGQEFPSIIGAGNILATQFHPEKSGRFGLLLLENFLRWDGVYAQ